MLFDVLLFILGILTGGIAAIVGFGVGSFLTPILALKTGFGVAVAAVGMAHFFGSAVRFWLFKHDINRKVLISFGILSAVGGLLGALLQGRAASGALVVVFGGLMVLTGVSGLIGWAEKINVRGPLAGVFGIVSGFFGGLVGNQGGLRAAGLMGFKLSKTQFVATMTAVALAVDTFRIPVYISVHSSELGRLIPEITIMSAGVVVGTFIGAPLLRRLPDKYFARALSIIVIAVGVLVAIGL